MKKYLPFLVMIALQVLILALVPARTLMTRAVGEEISLPLAPIDPYDMWSGYYVILNYDISRPDLTQWDKLKFEDGQTVWAVVKRDSVGAFRLSRFAKTKQENLSSNERQFVGTYRDGSIRYGIEAYFIPEARRLEIEQEVQKKREQTRMIVAVTSDGHAAVKRMVVGNKTYEF
ncbi:MAG: GDYXXLXY domain-containing protein [Bacteroidetes Order II. Incertae sedis bacterium]|nr:GDYXXLXY domain-containing protein [Bacteroidetes Order II. bacterium]